MDYKRNTNLVLPAIGLGLVLIFSGGTALGAQPGRPAAAGEAAAPQPAAGRNPFTYPPRILKEMAGAKTAGGKEAAGDKTPQREYRLSGILWAERGGVASINQRILLEGDSLDEYRVFRIERNRVILKKEGEEIVLNLFQSPVMISEQREPRSSQKKKFP